MVTEKNLENHRKNETRKKTRKPFSKNACIDPRQFFKHRVRLQRPNLEAKMNAKETDEQACNINAAGRAMLRKNFILRDVTALQQVTSGQSPEAKAGTWRTSSGDAARAYRGQHGQPFFPKRTPQ